MSQHVATVMWKRNGEAFTDGRYSRAHRWGFDGDVAVTASASPHVVPPPLSVERAIDPEEAFVAALASCHMLWFLSIAAKRGFGVESYRDEAAGTMGQNADGKLAITEVVLRPRVTFFGDGRPTAAEHEAMHRDAHERCYIASSVTSTVRSEPVDVTGGREPE